MQKTSMQYNAVLSSWYAALRQARMTCAVQGAAGCAQQIKCWRFCSGASADDEDDWAEIKWKKIMPAFDVRSEKIFGFANYVSKYDEAFWAEQIDWNCNNFTNNCIASVEAERLFGCQSLSKAIWGRLCSMTDCQTLWIVIVVNAFTSSKFIRLKRSCRQVC